MTNESERKPPLPKPEVGSETSKEVRDRLNPSKAEESKAPLPDSTVPDEPGHMGAVEEEVKQTRPPTDEMGQVLGTDRAKATDEEDGIDPADLITTPG